ncbi:hypothetical protein [uncultured Winogradskyella sp.]|uniref:hypothetical protein n=1 Tax=uncultured Winogradskyella sp. TaxID=395353 RepID=UPI002625DB63|nr:hypothetical protein [uncultured Winogradskyella sp.]
MKLRLQHLLSLLIISIIFSCSDKEPIEDAAYQNYFAVTEYSIPENLSSRPSTSADYCFTVDLIAGQNMYAGTVTISKTETDLILTYNTYGAWTIGTTHVSIGDCNEEWVPLTGSGNPKIGKFGHTEPHSENINRVVYEISLDVLPDYTDLYCFAAHAEVEGPNGEETAWAGGDNGGIGGIGRSATSTNSQYGYTVKEFEGRSWATYIEAYQWACGIW